MAHRRGSVRRGISQSQRRKKTWVQLKTLIAAGAGSPGFQQVQRIEISPSVTQGDGVKDGFIAMSGDGSGVSPFESTIPSESTILRVRGSLLFPKNIVSILLTSGDTQFNFGFGVTGITDNNADSYPGPGSDPDWDGWMFLRQSALPPVEANSGIIDVKAMRKVQSGDAFFVMAETISLASVGTVGDWVFDLRLLVLLP